MVQIKQEPLEIIYAAEMADIEGDATNSSNSSRSNEGSFDISDKRAYSLLKPVNTGNFHANVTIKVEPDMYEYNYTTAKFGEATEIDDINQEENSMSSESMAQNIQVKEEPEDDYLYIAEDYNMSEDLPYSTNDTHDDEEDQLNALSDDFQVVDEHENIITITANDLSPNSTELAFKQKCIQNRNKNFTNFDNSRPQNGRTCNRRIKKYMCKICLKRCQEELQYRQHMEQHRRNRLYCTRKACDEWFSTLEECEKHEYVLHSVKHLKCNVCNHKFLNFEQLCQHKETMHGKLKRFVCSMCRDWFISMDELQEHWQSLPDRCGRMLSILSETPKLSNILKLAKQEAYAKNSYKIKCAYTGATAGLKLRLKPSLLKSPEQQCVREQASTVEIKQEHVDYETILPDFTVKVKNESLLKIENSESVTASEKQLVVSPLKLRIRKQLLSRTENENVTTPQTQEFRTNPLSHLLAQRITSKFALKSVPKYFNLVSKAGEGEILKKPATTTSPQSLLKSSVALQQRNANAAQTAKISPKSENAPKMLKLSSNFRIVKMLPKEAQPSLIKLTNNNNNSSTFPHATTKHTTTMATKTQESLLAKKQLRVTETPPNNRYFEVKQIEVPPVNKVDVAAKLESVTITNTEISLTELLNDVIVQKNDEKNAEMTAEDNIEIKTEFIKTELDEDMLELQQQCDDSLSPATFSDSSSNAANSIRICHEGGDLPPRPRSPHLTRNRCRSKPKINPDGYICPNCKRRYTTRAMINEHLRSSCGRNPQHQCDICHKYFFSTSTLNCHRTIHTGAMPYKCNYCDKRFRTRGQVTVHHRTHTGERPFVCEICSQSFTHRETLISHLSRHIGMKRYKCYGCNKLFSCISGLSTHRATRPDTCGQFELNTRAIGPRVRVIRGRVVFEPQPTEPDVDEPEDINMNADTVVAPAVLAEIQNK